MLSRIAILFICVCMLGLVFFSYAQEGGEKPAENKGEVKKTDWKGVTGIVLQIVLFILFLGVIYYVFVYPEKPKTDEGEQQASESESEEGESSEDEGQESSEEDTEQKEDSDSDDNEESQEDENKKEDDDKDSND